MTRKTAVKICGLNDRTGLDSALNTGADFVGFVHFEKSPRHLSLPDAATLVGQIRAQNAQAATVVLLVNPSDDVVSEVVRLVRPDFIQLHGSEGPARVEGLQRAYNVRVIKAIGVSSPEDVHHAMAYDGVANRILFDAKPPSNGAVPGGNGLAFDWTILDAVTSGTRFMLAGGLTPDNVAEAITRTNAPAVDVSSGVESVPGRKDPELIRRFIEAAKAVTKTGAGA